MRFTLILVQLVFFAVALGIPIEHETDEAEVEPSPGKVASPFDPE